MSLPGPVIDRARMIASAGSAVLAVAFGFGAQRGGFCVITALEQIVAARSGRLFMAFFRASIWSALVSVPIFWFVPFAHVSPVFAITGTSLLGAMAFGIGAGVNGGCYLGTLTRLGAGDASYLLTLAGMASGIALAHGIARTDPATPVGETILAAPGAVGALVLAAAIPICLREVRVARTRLAPDRWPPEYAAILVGLSGGCLYVLFGDWSYIGALHRLVVGGGSGIGAALLVSAMALAGAMLAAATSGKLKPRAAVRPLPRRLAGGLLMGLGGAYIPGGNGALILQSIPALSPHALPAYILFSCGAAIVPVAARRLGPDGRLSRSDTMSGSPSAPAPRGDRP